MTNTVTVKSTQKAFDGEVKYCAMSSTANQCEMSFAIFLPPNARPKTAYLLFLSGLTCSEDNFVTKAGAFKKASELGVAIVIPDTSPRGEAVADDESYDLGQGAGFYLNATQSPWREHFNMESHIMNELLPAAEQTFGLDAKRKAISGHSMGGHGALTLYYKYPGAFTSCSAFAPIVAPSQVPWGHKAFSAYIGEDQAQWSQHDACALVAKADDRTLNSEILIDQGLADNFLEEQLKPELFEQACAQVGQALLLRRHEGYDHSYYFIQSFIEDHLEFHFR